jgi:hypothetical protein
MHIEKLKDAVQDCHLNFLIGSGLSKPYLETLGNIEILLTELETNVKLTSDKKNIIRCSILGRFFNEVIHRNVKIISHTGDPDVNAVLTNYRTFLSTMTAILLKRKSTILSKQINIFTTNIDVFLERALEDEQLEFNDGFSGRIKPIYSVANFSKTVFKNSLHFNNSAELPVFNLIKLHGSLTWKVELDKIHYSDLKIVDAVNHALNLILSDIAKVPDGCSISDLEAAIATYSLEVGHKEFLAIFKQLAIINPTKEKFHDTIMNLNYYEMLRVFSNELEKENSILMVLGFSVADEHIREILVRAANANPTLLVLVYCYDHNARITIDANIAKSNVGRKYNNILVIEPSATGSTFDFANLNAEVFTKLYEEINKA